MLWYFDLFFSSLLLIVVFLSMATNDLELLSNATSLERMFKEFQQQTQHQMEELHHEVATIKEDHVEPMPPEQTLDLGDDTPRSRGSSLLLESIPPRADH